ncbi:hypothetical protein [Sphingomonas solaris]|uniref:Uncharacterized protein n=1 Tax=Alterirhizorhabdus solaris TaxID=2529389 RepID=A0A558QZ66_9SPHN|nr:hypothetical protein [Sphingomonas solaris]TVV72362.1 hypothetical protein FOY91_14740 [Sphingomonas solaris]
MRELGTALERAEAVLNRVRSESTGIAGRARRRRWAALVRRLKLAMIAALAVMVAAAVLGLFVPLGIGGFFLAMVATFVVAGTILFWPSVPETTPAALVQTDIRLLPQRTEEWLERQRPALPAPAVRLVDGIGARLDALAPQLATIDANVPIAVELRKLMAEELPELVAGYQRVPVNLRRDESRGQSPDRQLVEGLTTVDSELARLAGQLAHGDLDRLATQNRYLELKYRGAGE